MRTRVCTVKYAPIRAVKFLSLIFYFSRKTARSIRDTRLRNDTCGCGRFFFFFSFLSSFTSYLREPVAARVSMMPALIMCKSEEHVRTYTSYIYIIVMDQSRFRESFGRRRAIQRTRGRESKLLCPRWCSSASPDVR